jgi:hypothetical protein
MFAYFYYGVEPPTVELAEMALSEILLLAGLDMALVDPLVAGTSTYKLSFKTFTRLIFYSSTSFLKV